MTLKIMFLLFSQQACTDTESMTRIKGAIMLLFRYAVNLLKQDKSSSHTNWRMISFDNSVYQLKVKVLKVRTRFDIEILTTEWQNIKDII